MQGAGCKRGTAGLSCTFILWNLTPDSRQQPQGNNLHDAAWDGGQTGRGEAHLHVYFRRTTRGEVSAKPGTSSLETMKTEGNRLNCG